MTFSFKLTRRGVLLAAAAPLVSWSNQPLAPALRAQSATNKVADFNEGTWAELLKHGPRAASNKKVELAAVVMDVPAERALVHARHFAGATKLYAFDGFEPAIRQSVDPKWPNVTPYIVLLGHNGSVQRSIGPPDASMLKKWLA